MHSRTRAPTQGLTSGQLSRGSRVCAQGRVRTRVHTSVSDAHLPSPPKVSTARPRGLRLQTVAWGGGVRDGPGGGGEAAFGLRTPPPRRDPTSPPEAPSGHPKSTDVREPHRRPPSGGPRPRPPPLLQPSPLRLLQETFDHAQKECATISALPRPPIPRPRRIRSRSRSRRCPACPAGSGLAERGPRRRPGLAPCLTQ